MKILLKQEIKNTLIQFSKLFIHFFHLFSILSIQTMLLKTNKLYFYISLLISVQVIIYVIVLDEVNNYKIWPHTLIRFSCLLTE